MLLHELQYSVRKLHIQQNYDKCVNAVATDPVNSNK